MSKLWICVAIVLIPLITAYPSSNKDGNSEADSNENFMMINDVSHLGFNI